MAPKPIDPRYQITVHSQPLDLRGLTNEQVDALRQRFAAAVDAAIERVMMSADNLKNALTSDGRKISTGTVAQPSPGALTPQKLLAAMNEVRKLVKDDKPTTMPSRLFCHENRKDDARALADALDHPPFSMRPDVQISTNVPPGFIVAMSGPTVLWIIKPDEEHA